MLFTIKPYLHLNCVLMITELFEMELVFDIFEMELVFDIFLH